MALPGTCLYCIGSRQLGVRTHPLSFYESRRRYHLLHSVVPRILYDQSLSPVRRHGRHLAPWAIAVGSVEFNLCRCSSMMLELEYGVPRESDQNKRPFNSIFFVPQKHSNTSHHYQQQPLPLFCPAVWRLPRSILFDAGPSTFFFPWVF